MSDRKVHPETQPSDSSEKPPVVVTTQPTYVKPVRLFRDVPVQVKCQHCQADIVTSIHVEIGTLTWLACGTIILVGFAFPLFWLGCCFIPFCVKALKDVVHTCPNCDQLVGRYDRLS